MAILLRKLSRLIVILALAASVGGHWALLQSVAWTRMLIERAQTQSFAEAVRNTLDGRHPCEMCQRITEGQEKEQKPERQNAKIKSDWVCVVHVITLLPPEEEMIFPAAEIEMPPRPEPPRLPPPKSA